MHNQSIQLDDLMPLIHERLASGESVRFSPHGTSMLPMLVDGRDQVVLSPLPEKLNKYDLPLYRRANGQYVLHRIVAVKEDYTCMGDNQFTPEYGIKRDQMIAVVTRFVHGGKEYSVNCQKYQMYCRIWCVVRPIRHILLKVRNGLRRIRNKVFQRLH